MNKLEIQIELDKSINQISSYIQNIPEEDLNKSIDVSWSINQNIEHLILSIKPIIIALKTPKVKLNWKFGKLKRQSKSYDELYQDYAAMLSKGAIATNKFTPTNTKELISKELMPKYISENSKLIKVLGTWSEEELNSYVLPHPILGSLSIKELLHFTCFHTEHHLNSIKKIACHQKK